ncbi:MAG: thioredoxin family protein [Chitinophagaceae bacterium]|nr:MAG: thioredoxin family protein [Chitinophagaceae bacterium]
MKKTLSLIFIILVIILSSSGQDMKSFKLYKPSEDGEKALATAVKSAKASGKHVFVQIGGNWCVWCARFHQFVTEDKSIDSLISKNYIVYHMNYSEENKNPALLKKLGYPQRFGFPVFIVLDGNGNRLHTQNSAYLEEDKGYNKGKVMEFFQHWAPAALNAESYKDY